MRSTKAMTKFLPTATFLLVAMLTLTACAPGPEAIVTDAVPLAEEQPEETVAEATEAEQPAEVDATEESADPEITSLPAPSLPNPDDYTWAPVASGFTQPLLLADAADGSGRLFIVGQRGTIWVMENNQVLAQPFLDIRDRVGSQANEQGLLGLAFAPDYEDSGQFYLNYTNLSGNTTISRFHVSADANVADAGSEEILLTVSQPYGNHNGGHIEFGPDGYLYIGLGDGGSAGDPAGNGQSLNTLLGKLLRIDVSGGDYSVPGDNPFGNEIWLYGLRNPWRFTFDRATGDIYIADVGQGNWEEVNFLPGGIVGGANFGWDYYEGDHSYESTPPDGANFIFPIAEYDHGGGRCSVTGGVVYRGESLPAWQGVYLYGDYCSGEIFGLVQGGDGEWQNELLFSTGFLITSFGQDEAGEVYVLDRNGGVYQLRAE